MMNSIKKTFAIKTGSQRWTYLCSLLLIGILFHSNLLAQTRLGLHVTQEEVNIWKQRAISGPYRIKGDTPQGGLAAGASNNYSPQNWKDIHNNALEFIANPSNELWQYKTSQTTTCLTAGADPVSGFDSPNTGKLTRDAAFVFRVFPDSTHYRDAVRTVLLNQAAEPSTDFSKTARWCVNTLRDAGTAHGHALWLQKLVTAYDYIKYTLNTTDKAILDTWFFNAAVYFQERNLDVNLETGLWVNRYNGIYDLIYNTPGYNGKTTYFGGDSIASVARWYNNRRSSQALFFNSVGIMLGLESNVDMLNVTKFYNGTSYFTPTATQVQSKYTLFKDRSKLFVKEWLMFSVYPNGNIGEMERWNTNETEEGYSYSLITIDHMMSIADQLARAGDNSLYTYSTPNLGKFGTEGAGKDIKLVAKRFCSFVANRVKVYASNVATTDPTKKIDGKLPPDAFNREYVGDTWLSQGNLYWKDSFIDSVITRTASGTTPYPQWTAGPGSGGAWRGGFDIYAGKLFMFGKTQVWPYPNLTLVVNAGADKVLTLPTNSTTLTGSATIGTGATIASYLWTKTSGPSATLTNANTATLSLTNLVIGNYTFELKVTDNKGSFKTDAVNVIVQSAPCSASGTIIREYWNNFSGTTIAQIPVTTTPDNTLTLTQFASPLHVADTYASRIRGYICVPVSGNYTFWIAGDDKCELYLSTNDNPANKVKIASVAAGTLSREWEKDIANQKSAVIALTAGISYYIEALQIENSGGDHVAVGWQLPSGTLERPIPASRISPFVTSGARLGAIAAASLEAENELHVYPNPFNDRISIELGKGQNGEVAITLVDGLGKVYHQSTKMLSEVRDENIIDLSGKNLKPGIYFLKINNGLSKGKVVKIIKH